MRGQTQGRPARTWPGFASSVPSRPPPSLPARASAAFKPLLPALCLLCVVSRAVRSPCRSTPRLLSPASPRGASPPTSPGPPARSCPPFCRNSMSTSFHALLSSSPPLTCSARIVNDPANEELIKWSDNGDSFYGASRLPLFTLFSSHPLFALSFPSPPSSLGHPRQSPKSPASQHSPLRREQSSTMSGLPARYLGAGSSTKNSRPLCAS